MAETDVIARLFLKVITGGTEQLGVVRADLAGLNAEVSRLNTTAASAALDKTGVSAENMKKAASGAMIGVGALAAVLGAVSADAAVKFQASMELVRTQAGASQHEVESMSSAVLDMATKVGTGPEELAQGLFHIESAGFRGAIALQILKAAAEGAKVGHADLESVTNALIAVTASHISGITSETQAMGILNGIVGAGNMRMQDLAGAMSTGVVSSAKVFGLSILDVGAALATLTDNGVPAQEAATRLRMTFALMGAPTHAAAAALSTIGLSSTQLATDMHKPEGLLVALQDLKKHLTESGMTAEQQAQVIARAFGGGRSSSAIMTLLEQLDRLHSKYGQIGDAAKKFGIDWDATTKTAAYQWSQLGADVEVIAVQIGEALLPPLTNIAEALIPVTKGFADFAKDNQAVVAPAIAAALAVGGLGVAIRVWSGAKDLATTYAHLLRIAIIGQGEAAAAAVAPTVAETVAVRELGVAAAQTSIEVEGLGTLSQRASGLFAPITAGARGAAVAEGEMAAGSEAAAGSAAGLGGAVGLLLQPEIGIPALAIALAVVSYEKIPAFHDAVNNKVVGILAIAQKGISDTTAKLNELGGAMDKAGNNTAKWQASIAGSTPVIGGLGNAAGALGEHLSKVNLSWQGFGKSVADSVPFLSKIGQGLDDAAKAHDRAAAAAKRHAEALKTLGELSGGKTLEVKDLRSGQAQIDAAGGAAAIAAQLTDQISAAEIKQITDAAKTSLDSLAVAIFNGTGNIGKLGTAAIQAATDALKLDNAQTQAAIRTELASSQWAAALRDMTSQAKAKLDDAEARIALAIVNHAAVTQQMIAQGRQALTGSATLTKAQQEAAKLIGDHTSTMGKAADKATKSITDFATAISKAASDSLANLTKAVFTGKTGPGLDKLEEKAIKAADAQAKYSGILDAQTIKVDLAGGRFSAALDLMRTHLETAAKDAAARLQLDRSRGASHGVVAGDVAQVEKTRAALADFEKQTKDAAAAGKVVTESFKSIQTHADDLTGKAIDRVALKLYDLHNHVSDTLPPLAKLKTEAEKDSRVSSDLAKAHGEAETAAKHVRLTFDELSQAASQRASTALELYAQKTYDSAHHVSDTLPPLSELKSRAIAAAKSADDYSKVHDQVAKAIKDAVSGVVKTFKDLETAASNKASKALSELTEKLYDQTHHIHDTIPPLSELKRAAILTAQSADGYGKAHTQAAAIVKAGTTKVVETFQTLDSAAQKLADSSLAALEKALLTGAGNLDTLSLSAAADAIKLETFGLATAEASIRVGLLTNNIDAVLKGLGDLATRARTQAVGQIVAGQAPNVTGAEGIDSLLARYAVAQSAVNAVLDLSEGKLDAFGKDVSEVSDYLKGQFFAGIVAGQGASQTLITQMVGLAQATATVKESEDGLSAILAAATGSLSEMSKSVGDLQGIFQTQWEQAILSDASAQNQYTGQLLASIQAQRDLTTAQNDEKVILGMLSGDAKLLADGLQGIFSQSMEKLAYFDDMIGRTGDGLAASSGNVETLTTDALSAADSLGSFGDIVKGVGDILSQLYDAGSKEVASMGQVTDATLAAAGAAYQQSQNLTGAGILSRLEIDKANKDVVDYAADLGDEFKFLQKKMINDEAQYGAGSPQVAADRAKLTQVQNEQTGLQSVIDAGGDWSKIGQTSADSSASIDKLKTSSDQAAAQVVSDQAALTKAQHDYGAGSQQAQQAQQKLTDDQNKAGDASKAYTTAVNSSGDAVSKATWAWGQFISGGIDPGIDALSQFSNFLKTTGTPTVQGLTTSMTTSHDEVVALGTAAADVATKLGTVSSGLVTFAQHLTSGISAQVVSVTASVVNILKGGMPSGHAEKEPAGPARTGTGPVDAATKAVASINTQAALQAAGIHMSAAAWSANVTANAGLNFANNVATAGRELASFAGQLPKLTSSGNPYVPYTDVPIAGGGQWHGPMTDQTHPTTSAPTSSPTGTTGTTGTPYTPYTGPTTGTGPTGEGGSQYVFPGGNGELTQIAQNTAKTADNTQKQLDAANKTIAHLREIIDGQADELKVSQDAMALYRQPGNRNLINGANQAGFFDTTNSAGNANPSGVGVYR